tara:strand:+ start:236 stop:1555 length:1320 start_codon:yes stop_codon:yes gene_type:complete
MRGEFDNIHQGLSQVEALKILTSCVEELGSRSDFYMAVSHLINFPNEETVDGLIGFLQVVSEEQSVLLAQRKAVEVLGRLCSKEAEQVIGQCLGSKDVYMVENAAWALGRLGTQDWGLHQAMMTLLSDAGQNRRVLIQTLSSLAIEEAQAQFTQLASDDVPSVAGAAIAALAKKGRVSQQQLTKLSDHLFLPNQMDRQSAVQDIIDAQAVSLLPDVIKAPISPAFKTRALKSLLDDNHLSCSDAAPLIQKIFQDNPQEMIVLHHYDCTHAPEFLVGELFCPDFSRCYLAMQELVKRDGQLIWPVLKQAWLDRAHNDYGAHYFFMHLFGLIDSWPLDSSSEIKEILLNAINDRRPQFRKSPPAALLSLALRFPDSFAQQLDSFFSGNKISSWQKRFAYLQALGLLQKPMWPDATSPFLAQLATTDAESLVRFKAQYLVEL